VVDGRDVGFVLSLEARSRRSINHIHLIILASMCSTYLTTEIGLSRKVNQIGWQNEPVSAIAVILPEK
jgi:hypothetical protein